MKVMTDAGVEFVPFDSQGLNDVSADAWGAGTESYAYEDTDTLARSHSCSPIHPQALPPPPLPLPTPPLPSQTIRSAIHSPE